MRTHPDVFYAETMALVNKQHLRIHFPNMQCYKQLDLTSRIAQQSTLHYKSLNNYASTRRHQQESSLYQRQQILSSLSFATTSISQHLINMVHNVLLSSSASSWISAVSGIHTRVNGSRLSAFHSLAFALLQHATEESSLTQDDEKLAILHTNLLRRLLSKQFTMMISHLKKKQQTQLLIFTSNLESTSEAAKTSTIQQTCAI